MIVQVDVVDTYVDVGRINFEIPLVAPRGPRSDAFL
jgi:hypothetical protein